MNAHQVTGHEGALGGTQSSPPAPLSTAAERPQGFPSTNQEAKVWTAIG
jgi:hypothetical protein